MTIELAPNRTNDIIHTMELATDLDGQRDVAESSDSIEAHREEQPEEEVVTQQIVLTQNNEQNRRRQEHTSGEEHARGRRRRIGKTQ